jgi:predicted HicB family RNase H-like nuclease
MNTMNYKGYTARIDFDERDDIFVGRVLGVRDHQFSRVFGQRIEGRIGDRHR